MAKKAEPKSKKEPAKKRGRPAKKAPVSEKLCASPGRTGFVDYCDAKGCKEVIMKLLYLLLVIGVFASGCSYCNRKLSLPDDHPLEEFAESYLEKETGYKMDFTPDSLEK